MNTRPPRSGPIPFLLPQSLLLSLLLLALAGAAGCASRTPACCRTETALTGPAPTPAPHLAPAASASASTNAGNNAGTGAWPDRSLFQLESRWTNDAAKPVLLADLAGRPIVAALFFARCEYACPVLVHDMKRIQSALPEELRSQVRFLLVSFDTERDTPVALAQYRGIHELPANWTLLRGGPDDVLELAALLGVKFRQDARGQFSHSNLLTVLNRSGEPVHQQVGLNGAPTETVRTLESLLRR